MYIYIYIGGYLLDWTGVYVHILLYSYMYVLSLCI